MVGLYYSVGNRITRSNLVRPQAYCVPSCYTTKYSCLGSTAILVYAGIYQYILVYTSIQYIPVYWCGLRVFPPNILHRRAFLMIKGGTSDVDSD